MMEDPRTITTCTNHLMVARYLERCGDHACTIAEEGPLHDYWRTD